LADQPWGHLFALLALAGLLGMRWFTAKGRELHAFLASSIYLAGMLASVAFGLYPYVLPAITDPALGLTVHGAAAADYGLKVGLVWWIPGMILAAGYFTFVYRQFQGKVRLEGEGY
jgi:cytochrome d ubiquinol oxidase subunit II